MAGEEIESRREKLRVLVVLGNLALNGQERGNIQVLYATKRLGVEALFLTHREWGHLHLQPYLDRLGLAWTPLGYARHFTKSLSLRGWIANIRRLVTASLEFRRTMKQYGPTHIHVANPHYFLSVLPALMLTRTPVVYRLGDEPTQHHALYRLLWRWCIVPRVQTFVCVSKHVQARAVESGVPRDKTRVIYSHPPVRPQRVTASDSDADLFNGKTIAYVGQLAPHKGVDLLVEAAIRLCSARDDLRFVLAGTAVARDPFAHALVGKVAALGMEDRIQFLGYVEDVPDILARADVHVCPSRAGEALSNTILEAKHASTPSVVFPSGGLPEVIAHGRDGYVCAGSTAAELQRGIEYFLDMDDAALREAGAAARASLDPLGATTEAFARAWLRAYEGEPEHQAGAARQLSEVIT